jgi:hypothetical protein
MRAWLSAIVIGLALAPLGAKAWTQHALGTWQALQVLPDARQEPPVRVESLEQFLRTQGTALELILREEEQWARANVRNYAPRPEVLAYRFDPKAEAPEWRRRFMAAVRINPSLPLTPFLQLQPLPSVLSANARMEIPVREVVAPGAEAAAAGHRLVALREGEAVPVIDVIASASDEPDYGMDLGLWADSGTEAGRLYGLGKPPWSALQLAQGEQALFHRGFYHESSWVYALVEGANRSLLESRMHLWQTLARHARVTGHAYWSWRFAGWAMHYAQELTQPYRARLLPGVSPLQLVSWRFMNAVGASRALEQAFAQSNQRMLALEQYQQQVLFGALSRGELQHPWIQALGHMREDIGRLVLPERGLREQVARHAFMRADVLDEWVSRGIAPSAELDGLLTELAGDFGSVTRAIWRRLQ